MTMQGMLIVACVYASLVVMAQLLSNLFYNVVVDKEGYHHPLPKCLMYSLMSSCKEEGRKEGAVSTIIALVLLA